MDTYRCAHNGQHPYLLSLRPDGLDQSLTALTFIDIKEGNIILDVVLRSTKEITHSDIAELYGVGADSPQGASLLKTAIERGLQVLEINPSYGAQGLAPFQTWDLTQREVQA